LPDKVNFYDLFYRLAGFAAGLDGGPRAAPAAIADCPGAAGPEEAVFEVGPGTHSFSGPAGHAMISHESDHGI
jgi:hypothetical protein